MGMENLKCEFDFVSNACGSVLANQSDSCSVLCVVNGPTEVKYAHEIIDRSTVHVEFIPLNRQPDPNDRNLSAYLKQIVQRMIITSLHPRSLITITLQQIKEGTNLVSVCVNAMCLALIDASIPLHSAFCCIPVELEQKNTFVYFTHALGKKSPISIYTDGAVANLSLIKDAYKSCLDKSQLAFSILKTKLKGNFELQP